MDSAGILEDSYEEVELSIKANLISSFYSHDNCINDIRKHGFTEKTNRQRLINQLWNKSSLVEAAFFSADIVNSVLQFLCAETHIKTRGL